MYQLLQRCRVSKPRSRRVEVERIETNIEIGAQSEIDRKDQERAEDSDENETNKAKIETKKGSEKQCFTVRFFLTKEKLKDKSPRRLVSVEAHHEEVQGRELRGQGNFERNTDLIETTRARLHKAYTVARRNTNLEELTKAREGSR